MPRIPLPGPHLSRALGVIALLVFIAAAACTAEPAGPRVPGDQPGLPADTTAGDPPDSTGVTPPDSSGVTPPDTGTVTPPDSGVPPARFPNQPAGFQRFLESQADQLAPTHFGTVAGWTGGWVYRGQGMQLDSAAALPGASGSLRTTFGLTLPAGTAPTSLAGWSGTQSNPTQYRQVYLSMWVKVGTPAGFLNQTALTKFGFISYGEQPAKARNQGLFFLQGNGAVSVMTAMELRFQQQGMVDRLLPANRNVSRAKITTGTWHQVEAVFEANSQPGAKDGRLRIWLDGVATLDYTDVTYTTPRSTRTFQWYDWNPTWGGVGGVRTQTDYIWIDHLYLSGVP